VTSLNRQVSVITHIFKREEKASFQ